MHAVDELSTFELVSGHARTLCTIRRVHERCFPGEAPGDGVETDTAFCDRLCVLHEADACTWFVLRVGLSRRVAGARPPRV